MKNLLEEFPAVDKATWVAKVEKDLKGKPLEDLFWHLGEDLSIAPFYHPEDMSHQATAPLLAGRRDNDWEIGEYINVYEDTKKANQELLEGLKGGVQAPLFRLFHPLNAGRLNQLLEGVAPEMVTLNFSEHYTEKQPAQLFTLLRAWYKEKGVTGPSANFTIDFDPILDFPKLPVELMAELIKSCAAEWPKVRPLQVNAKTFHGGPEQVVEELALTMAKGAEYLSLLTAQGIDPDTSNQHMQFGIAISKSYFVEIAKFRALRLLWSNILKGYGVKGKQPFVVGHFAQESQDENPNANMIRASTQAMSAVIGGIDRLYVLPSSHAQKEADTPFSRRVARNLQHLLKMESHLDRVIDPGAGSYYIEKLTREIADRAWARFQELDKTEAFK
ncbi:MAG: methylmalonyl-CoA mutase family protein [Phaeodactylibacter sp.]|uniref:methylmalonyl-CoA mutase family protein n=1 Tax=Phaeodactylibacter sp. TaxID=1940289 RepID=UPI0032EB73BE